MSRYRTTNDAGEAFDYGFDAPLGEYFLQKNAPEEEAGCIELVGSLSDTPGTGGRLLEAIEKHKVRVPDEHLSAMALDLPF